MTDNDTINVLITSFGPFPRLDGGSYERNSSHEITKLIPATLNPYTRFNPSNRKINILNPTAADGSHVRVEYAYIRAYTSALHTSHASNVHLIVHIGQAAGWDYVSVERRAYKQGFSSDWAGPSKKYQTYYCIPDAVGQSVKDAGACPWGDDVPIGLKTGMDVDAIVAGAGKTLGFEPLRKVLPHDDPGTYCCGFIFYESLANKLVKHTRAEVLFCHVPSELDSASLEAGRDAIVAVIGAAVSQLLARGGRNKVTVPVQQPSAQQPSVQRNESGI